MNLTREITRNVSLGQRTTASWQCEWYCNGSNTHTQSLSVCLSVCAKQPHSAMEPTDRL